MLIFQHLTQLLEVFLGNCCYWPIYNIFFMQWIIKKAVYVFLRNLGNNIGGNLLEVLILRDCMHLKEVRIVYCFDTLFPKIACRLIIFSHADGSCSFYDIITCWRFQVSSTSSEFDGN